MYPRYVSALRLVGSEWAARPLHGLDLVECPGGLLVRETVDGRQAGVCPPGSERLAELVGRAAY
jgi:hypothetical protein